MEMECSKMREAMRDSVEDGCRILYRFVGEGVGDVEDAEGWEVGALKELPNTLPCAVSGKSFEVDEREVGVCLERHVDFEP